MEISSAVWKLWGVKVGTDIQMLANISAVSNKRTMFCTIQNHENRYSCSKVMRLVSLGVRVRWFVFLILWQITCWTIKSLWPTVTNQLKRCNMTSGRAIDLKLDLQPNHPIFLCDIYVPATTTIVVSLGFQMIVSWVYFYLWAEISKYLFL